MDDDNNCEECSEELGCWGCSRCQRCHDEERCDEGPP